ncbi:MAG: dihydropyrimidinase [Actinobacteria bacterium]|nr:dihydropyrimidinase [Actinomycetota bacterium]
MRILIKNGTVVTAADTYRADVLVEEGIIAAISRSAADRQEAAFDRAIDAAGKYVIPGGIDVHTHLNMPFGGSTSSDDFETGTRAAAFGGTTSVVDFAIQYQGQSLQQAFENWLARAEGKAVADYGLHMIITDLNDAILDEMSSMVRQGVTSFKLFMAYPGVFLADDATIYRSLVRAGELGGLVCMHAENGWVIDVLVKEARARGQKAPKYHALTRPSITEGEATRRALTLAEMVGAPIYIVHLSAAEALDAVRQARDRGQAAYAETCPQYLFLSEDNYEESDFGGAKYVMSPPLRPKYHQAELWRGLASGDLHAVATDHCPFNFKGQKEMGRDDFSQIPNGAPGIETRMYLMYDGGVGQRRISLNRFVEVTATAPAKLFGLFPRKGTVAVGSDADLVVWDPDARHVISAATHHMNVDYNPYEGREVTGAPTHVLSRGEVIVEGDQFLGRPGRGQYLKRGTFEDA